MQHPFAFPLLLFVVSCVPAFAAPTSPNLPTLSKEIDSFIEEHLEKSTFPGAVVWVGTRDSVLFEKAYGVQSVVPAEAISKDTIFNLASVTKVLAGTAAALKLVNDRRLSLDDHVSKYLPSFAKRHPELKVHHLLDHSSGLEGGMLIYRDRRRGVRANADRSLRYIRKHKARFRPGTQERYSDVGHVVLARVIEAITNERLDAFLKREVYVPLEMQDTTYVLSKSQIARTAPSRPDASLRARAADPIAQMSSTQKHRPAHAGLFSTAADVGKFAQMILRANDVTPRSSIFRSESLQMTPTSFGWCHGFVDLSDDCSVISKEGYTGTFLYVDKARGFAMVYLTNRTHSDNTSNVYAPQFFALAEIVAKSF